MLSDWRSCYAGRVGMMCVCTVLFRRVTNILCRGVVIKSLNNSPRR